jgi:hypothetical protein
MEVPETSWSDTSWSDAAWKVCEAVESCVEIFADGRLGANKNRYKAIASTSGRLLRELSKLNTTERRHLSANLQDLEKSLNEIGRAAFYLKLARRRRSRPPDSVKYPHIRHLIYDLDIIAGVHGRELTLYREVGEKKGSLQAILDILHSLSPVIFPADIAFNTLKAMRRWGKERLEDEGQRYLSHLDDDDPHLDEDGRSA